MNGWIILVALLVPYAVGCVIFLSLFKIAKRREVAWFERLDGTAHVRHCITCGRLLTTREERGQGFCGRHWGKQRPNIFGRGSESAAEGENNKQNGKTKEQKHEFN